MTANVKNGTPFHGPSLCETCTHAHIERGYRASEKRVFCAAHEPSHAVPFAMNECTSYRDKTRQSLWEMEQIAWILAPRGSKREAGFVRASELRKKTDEVELILDHEK
jgi:hypothetical protein